MKEKKVKRFIADCGRGFWNKKACLKHEEVCKCWTNPKYKTCKTCFFAWVDGEDGWQCDNKEFNYDLHFTPAHEKANDLCINCPVWKSNKPEKENEN